MPRRVYTYHAGFGLDASNLISTIGVSVFAVGLLVTAWNVIQSRFAGIPAAPNPWGAATLEWATASPPDHFNFANIPVVASGEPLWNNGVLPGPAFGDARLSPRTSVLDAELEHQIELPHENLWTVVASIALLGAFAALLVRWHWTAAACGVLTMVSIARWMWPLPARVRETEA